MRRLLTFLLVFLVFVPVCANALIDPSATENTLFASLPDQDLLMYRDLIKDEIGKRGLGITLLDGEYLVGRDIAPGYYRIECIQFENGYYTIHIQISFDYFQ